MSNTEREITVEDINNLFDGLENQLNEALKERDRKAEELAKRMVESYISKVVAFSIEIGEPLPENHTGKQFLEMSRKHSERNN